MKTVFGDLAALDLEDASRYMYVHVYTCTSGQGCESNCKT